MPDGQPANGGDLMTIDTFRDFELAFQWKVAPGANSGVKYNVSEEFSLAERVEPRGARLRVPGARRFAERRQQARDASRGRALRPAPAERQEASEAGWSNGTARVSCFAAIMASTGSTARRSSSSIWARRAWTRLLAKSKYRTIAGFAERRTGHIILQDHGDEAFYPRHQDSGVQAIGHPTLDMTDDDLSTRRDFLKTVVACAGLGLRS